ncbi:MAG: AAA family ATPase [Flavobacteriales bacterium]|nr:AAA family ATPase [Flavobacteriales bacterium]MCB9168381.1 AAA family ATPase [Flavobacteriales bacterium]
MIISKLLIRNYKSFEGDFALELNPTFNVIVGDNECGKSTILEAIHLGLSGQLNGRNLNYELTPHLFNKAVIDRYVQEVKANKAAVLPEILIEVYLTPDDDLADYRGSVNTAKDDVPGFRLEVRFRSEFAEEYGHYVEKAKEIRTVPVEYYEARLFSFSGQQVMRGLGGEVTFIDTTAARAQNGTDLYISRIVKDLLTNKQRAELAVNHRKLKEQFSDEPSVKAINEELQRHQGKITDKVLALSLDVSSRTNWETVLAAYLNDIPFHQIGKGEQSSVKIKLALEKKAAQTASIILLEEPENHLSYARMNVLLEQVNTRCLDKQLIAVTHSSFVLNKLGLDKLILLTERKTTMSLKSLSEGTYSYFKKLSGYDTLRIVLAEKPILVEGPSDELILLKVFAQQNGGRHPSSAGFDIISVAGLAAARYLEVAKLLGKSITVVRDNDGKDRASLESRYSKVLGMSRVLFDDDTSCRTLEPQLIKSIGLDKLNTLYKLECTTDEELAEWMSDRKTSCALRLLESSETWSFPQYLLDAFK